MANDAYSCPLGEVVAAGRNFLPSWVPPIGSIADVALNTTFGATGDGTTSALFNAWCSMAYSPTWGKYGSLVFHGGGHGDREKNAILRYDIETRLVSTSQPNAPTFLHADNYDADTETGWLWAATTGTDVQVGQPFVHHTYANLIVIPESAIPGTAPNGWLITPGRGSMPLPGQIGTNQVTKFALGVDSLWSYAGSPLSTRAGHAWTLHDPVRNRLVTAAGDDPYANYLQTYDLATGTPGVFNFTGAALYSYYQVGKYSVSNDLYISARWYTSGLVLDVIDPASGIHYKPTVAGVPPVSTYEGSWEWADELQTFVFFQSDSNTVYTLKPSGNPRDSVWSWGSYTLSGTVTPHVTSAPGYKNLQYVHALRGFIFAAKYTSPFQMFRIPTP